MNILNFKKLEQIKITFKHKNPTIVESIVIGQYLKTNSKFIYLLHQQDNINITTVSRVLLNSIITVESV